MNEKNYFAGKIEDMISREAKGEAMVFSSFLTAEEGAEASMICRRASAPFCLYGGYDGSERKILAVSSLDQEVLLPCFPIVLMQIQGGDLSKITNRDVLGALMATGIRRDVLGDIIVRDGFALFFAADHIKDFLIQNVTSVGRQNVKLSEASEDFQIPEPHFEILRLTVASLRADAVIGGLARVSREQANRLIDGKYVFVNHTQLEKKTKEISAGDNIVIRGSGKWIVDECGDLTKKGRTVLICRKYI
ncbi:MAG: hypothetical protein IJ043_06735 [Clostridia bacterium]|nr:hypothetical protein [Clostridia bacterium]